MVGIVINIGKLVICSNSAGKFNAISRSDLEWVELTPLRFRRHPLHQELDINSDFHAFI